MPNHLILTFERSHAVMRPGHTEQFLRDMIGVSMEKVLSEKKFVLLCNEAQTMSRTVVLRWPAATRSVITRCKGDSHYAFRVLTFELLVNKCQNSNQRELFYAIHQR